ncbi:MAG: hypothetical protein ACRD2O_08265 [Terriglobia bacterium]
MKQRSIGIMKVLLPMLAMALAVSGRAQSATCTMASLSGAYAFTVTGQFVAGPPMGPIAGVAMTTFDGKGGLSQVDHVLHNGVPPLEDWRPGAGTYTVNGNCTGTATINFTDGSPSLKLYFVLGKEGHEIRTVVSNSEAAITSIGVRVNSPF